jgi:hypothetical protein
MIKNITRKLCLGLTLAALVAPAGTAIAQPTTPPPTNPTVVTGTDPEPQIVRQIILTIILST